MSAFLLKDNTPALGKGYYQPRGIDNLVPVVR